MFMKRIHPFLTKKDARHIFTKQRVPRHQALNHFLEILWCYGTENGNNCTATAKYTSIDTNTATSTITAIIRLWLLLLQIDYCTTIHHAMFTNTSSESIISTNKRYHIGKLLEKWNMENIGTKSTNMNYIMLFWPCLLQKLINLTFYGSS